MPELFEHHAHRTEPATSERLPPKPWAAFRGSIKRRWLLPLLFVDWLCAWAAYLLSRLSILELLEYCSSFSLLVALIFYFAEAPERTKMKHYQAWQVINSAQGKGGSGGRIEALHELNEDHVSLLGVDVSDSFLQGVELRRAELTRADLSSADLRRAVLRHATLASANLHFTNLIDADLSSADVAGAELDDADLEHADLRGLAHWQSIKSIQRANIRDVRNPPPGFVEWAMARGAVVSEAATKPSP